MSEAEESRGGEVSALLLTRWARIEQLFHDTADLKPDRCERYLDEHCTDDPTLKPEVRALLGASAAVGDLLSASQPVASSHLAREVSGDRWLGRIVDGFRLESLLGRGGMGVVYLGRRVDGLLSQQVAVKVMAIHLHGTPALARFKLERDALAALEHPHIARLVGGGVTDDRFPFVVMEYVEGRRLDHECDEPGVTLDRIVEWMLQLSAAVSYVHRNLLLHRDLKPGNVMVNAEGAVKLLDFGALKAIGTASGTDSTLTQAGMRPVTLRYASPEHIRAEAGTTALDVYSLGMTLYRLVAGQLPAMPDRSSEAYLEALKLDSFPPPGSLSGTRWSGQQSRLLADLDAIALRAIRFEAAARYDGVDAFADDLRRALTGRPVTARERTLRWRLTCFLRRNGTMVAGTLVASLVLGAGIVGIRYQTQVARAETQRAEAGVDDERHLAHLLLFDYFDQLKRIPGSTVAQGKAVAQALAYLNSLSPQDMTPEVQLESVQAYTELGSLEGNPYEENLGNVPGAIAALEKAVRLSQKLLATRPDDLAYLQSATAARLAIGRVYFGSGNPKAAANFLIPAADACWRIASLPHMTSADLAQAASVVDALGDVYGLEGAVTLNDRVGAIYRYDMAQKIDAAGLRADPGCSRCRRGVALEDWKIGQLSEDQEEAREHFTQGLRTLAPFPPEEQASVRVRRIDTVLRQQLATLNVHNGHVKDGLEMLEEVRRRFVSAVEADPLDTRARHDLIGTDFSRSEAYEEIGRIKLEEQADHELLDNIETLLKQDESNIQWRFTRASILLRYGNLLSRKHQLSESSRVRRESVEVLVSLTQLADPTPELLRVTAQSLVDYPGLVEHDANLGVQIALRSIAATLHPTAEQYITLAEAQMLGGMSALAHASAHTAVVLLASTPKTATNVKLLGRVKRLGLN